MVPDEPAARILMVEDDAVIREATQLTLERHGYDVTTAEDGAQALELLERGPVDLVVSDLEMPRVDGLELTRRLKRHPTLGWLPVVVVTTRAAEEDRRRGLEAGAAAYLTKGDLVRQDLVDVVRRLLGQAG